MTGLGFARYVSHGAAYGFQNFGNTGVSGEYLAEDFLFPHPSGYELGILSSKIEDYHLVTRRVYRESTGRVLSWTVSPSHIFHARIIS